MKNNTAIILILLSFGLFYTFTKVEYENVKVSRAVASEYQDVLQDASAIAELRDRLLVTYESFPRAEIEKLNKVLPESVDTVKLALDLDTMASRYGISISNIKVAPSTNNDASLIVLPGNSGAYERTAISFSFISNYENFTRLLADLEKSLRIMDIKSISFQTNETGLFSYQILVDTYWLK
ncbi:MAG: type 4a pilus biogenesis protein PilO [bacterium]|nr:type 4a pilus biogenesis protein PilO [bacterium]